MTERAAPRLSLVLALAGALLVVLQLSVDVWSDAPQSPLPVFHKSAPEVGGWPLHIVLPVG